MNTSTHPVRPKGIVHSSPESSSRKRAMVARPRALGGFTISALLAGLLLLLFSAPAVRAQGTPPGCVGSAIGISLFTAAPDVHVGDTIFYSASVFNGLPGNPTSCDASNIVAWITTPDGVVHPIALTRSYLSHSQSDFYENVASYVVRAQDIRPDDTVRAVAEVTAIILQGETPSSGGANQGVNTVVSRPCIKLAVQCVGGVGENGAITFTGTVTNCGNNTLVGVTVTNSVNGGQFEVAFLETLARGQVASFSGSWIPLNPCSPSTATFTARGTDQFTSNPRTVSSSADTTCQNTLSPGIKVTKVCPEQPVRPGQLLTFSGSVSNTGNVTLTNIVVVNNQPAANTQVFTRATLSPGEVANFTGSYLAPANCSVADTLTASAASRCGTGVSSVASATCPILTTPQIAVTAACPTAPVVPGGSLVYSGTVRNLGDTILNNIVVVSDRPAPNTPVLTVASLAPGASANFTSSQTAPADACAVTSTFSARGTDACTPNTVTNTVSTTCQITTAPAVAVTLACPTTAVATGSLITFSGTVRNSGNVTLNNVTVVNNQAVPSTVLTVPSLAPGASANFTASFTTPADACSVSSTVTASGSDNCTGAVVNNSASATCNLTTDPRIVVTQTCPPGTSGLGGLLTYSGSVSNAGNITLTNVVVTNDRTGATAVFTAATLAPGQTANFTGSYTVPLNSGCAITSTLTANARNQCTGAQVTASAPATCPVQGAPDISVTLACPTTPTALGGTLTFTGSVRNDGNITLTNVVVTRNAPGPNAVVLTRATLAPGASATFTGSYTVPVSDICSIATSVSATANDQCAGAGVSANAVVNCPLVAAPSLRVTQTCPTSPIMPGGLVAYSGTVSNTGNITLTNITVVSSQPAANTVVFSAASLAPGAVTNFSGSYTAPLNACSTSSTLTASGRNQCDGATVNNSVTTTCPLVTAPQITVTKNCPVNPVTEGGLLTFTGTVTNTGNVTLNNVFVVNNRPAANTAVIGPLTLAPGAGASFSGSYTAPLNVCSVTDTLTASGRDNCTGTVVTNAISATCPITTVPRIAVTLNCPVSPATVGGPITFTGTVRNSGNVTLNNVTVVNNQSSPSTVFTAASLAPGATASFTASFTAPANVCEVSSTVVATGSDACGVVSVTANASATCPLLTAAQIVVTQDCPVQPVTPGGVVTYSGRVRNAGNITLSNVVVTSGGSVVQPTNTVTTTYYVDDAVPAGATLFTYGGDSWNWVTSNPTPFSGTRAHQSNIAPGVHQHVFYNATATFPISAGDVLVTHVYLDPANVPSQVMIGWYDGSHDHRAYWGANLIDLGTDGTVSRRYMGPLPPVGQWVRLEVPASLVGVEGRTLSGMAFTLYGGRATWDAAGKSSQTTPPPPQGGTTVFSLATLAPGEVADFTVNYTVPTSAACTFTSTLNASGANPCTGVRVSNSVSSVCPVVTTPGIVVTQSCPPNQVAPGGILTYTGTVRNTGNITLTNVVVVNNEPAPNTVVFTVATLAPGASANFTGSYVVPLNCCVSSSTVTATGRDICTGVTVADTFTATCTALTVPRIVVTKTCPPTAVRTGEVMQYSGTVSNAGNITLVDVTLVNNQPNTGSPVWGPIILAPGESVSYYASYIVSPDFCGTDTVTARGLDACTYAPVVNSVTRTCPVITTPRIFVTKYCPPEPTPHLSPLIFTGTVSNPGDVTLTNVYVVNNRPTNNTPVIGPITLAPGESLNFAGSYITPEYCCDIVDTLTARGQGRCSGEQVTATATAICPLLNTPRIAVVKNCPETTVPVGGLLTFTGSVSNSGDTVLTNVYVVSSQPAPNTPLLGPIELAPGERKTFSGSYTVTANSNQQLDTVTARGMNTCAGVTTTATANCLGPVEAGPPSIALVTVAGGVATVTWSATPGTVYTLQCKASAAATNWVDVPGNVTASGSTASKSEVVGTNTQRFYRILVVE